VRNDSGVIFVDNRPYILCDVTYLRRERDGEDAIANISLAAWRMFDRLARASEYGRVISPGIVVVASRRSLVASGRSTRTRWRIRTAKSE